MPDKMTAIVCLCMMASVMARWSARILQNACRNGLKLLMTMRGMKCAENTTIFILAQTNNYKHISQVNLLFPVSLSNLFNSFQDLSFCIVHKAYPITLLKNMKH